MSFRSRRVAQGPARPKLLDQCGNSKFKFFYGKAHPNTPNTVVCTRPERHQTGRDALGFVKCCGSNQATTTLPHLPTSRSIKC
jgi:hypothetical protein